MDEASVIMQSISINDIGEKLCGIQVDLLRSCDFYSIQNRYAKWGKLLVLILSHHTVVVQFAKCTAAL